MSSGYYGLGERGFIVCYARMVGRGDNGDDKPWLGFFYGSWLPRVRIVRTPGYWAVDWRWLCFFGEVGYGT